MRMSQALIPTLRDVPSEAVIPSHQLLLKAGFIHKTAAGMYNYLPLGIRVLKKVEAIVREEMDRFGGQELLMPITQPAELWKESGRWDAYGQEMWRVQDRHGRQFCLGPTHEEMITDIARQLLESYKQLPMRLYQIANKYRDERRPRFGLMRGREFIMKDLYSFDLDEAGLDAAYQDMYQAYCNIFSRCGLTYRPVLADSGAIGGGYTHEFMVLAENGEGTIATCPHCDYAANLEIAETDLSNELPYPQDEQVVEKIATPDVKTIDALATFLDMDPHYCIKTLMVKADDALIAVLVRGNHQINDVKIQRVHPCDEITMASDEEIAERLGAHPGSLGPVGMPADIPVYADLALKGAQGCVVGANENDYHLLHVNLERDAKVNGYFDLREIEEGDPCPTCGQPLTFKRGIEVGQVFKLGTKYSEAMGATVLDENGKKRVLQMGCYGIGVSRTVAAAVEEYHDEKGIIWPKNLAPYQVQLIVINPKDAEQEALGNELYQELSEAGIEVLYDDRKERAGVKFNDADLIGLPVRLIVGKKSVSEGGFEWKLRDGSEEMNLSREDILAKIQAYYQ